MDFSWDENKRLETISRRKLDFNRAVLFFDGRPVIHQFSPRHYEDRWQSTAEMDYVLYTLVWMWRGETRRIIP
jgi:uncharacterized DUF497 family protein